MEYFFCDLHGVPLFESFSAVQDTNRDPFVISCYLQDMTAADCILWRLVSTPCVNYCH
jgi:hypothetical protein